MSVDISSVYLTESQSIIILLFLASNIFSFVIYDVHIRMLKAEKSIQGGRQLSKLGEDMWWAKSDFSPLNRV